MSYPKWWNDTVTVFNKYLDADRIPQYKKTYIDGCFFSTASSMSDKSGNQLISDGYTVRIRKDDRYVNNYLWNEELENKFTIKNDDIIVKGIIEDEINENEFGQTANDLLIKYSSNAFKIKAFKENLKIDLPHYWITGE